MTRKIVLFLANNSGGLFRFRKELMQRLINDGYDVYASTPFDDNVNDLLEMRVNLIETNINRRGMNPIKDLKLICTYFKMIKKINPKLIVTYTIKPNLYGGLISLFLNKKYAINITGLGTAFQKNNLIKKFVIVLYKIVCRKVIVCFFENKGNMEVFINNNIIKSSKCKVLNGAGVNLDDFFLSEYPKCEKPLHFLFIGRIMEEKGIDELFYAMEKLYMEGYNIVLDILGHYEDDYITRVKQLEKLGVVRYHGYHDNVQDYIRNSHCFVLPSYHEGMANTLLECASMGRPLITSNIHGCKEAINDNGYLCHVKDSHDLYLKLKQFIELDYETKKQLGLQSRKHMEEVFDKNKVVEETMKGLGL